MTADQTRSSLVDHPRVAYSTLVKDIDVPALKTEVPVLVAFQRRICSCSYSTGSSGASGPASLWRGGSGTNFADVSAATRGNADTYIDFVDQNPEGLGEAPLGAVLLLVLVGVSEYSPDKSCRLPVSPSSCRFSICFFISSFSRRAAVFSPSPYIRHQNTPKMPSRLYTLSSFIVVCVWLPSSFAPQH